MLTEDPKPRIIDDRYELRDLIGRGGMGAVHIAYDRATGDTLALKMVQVRDTTIPSIADTEDASERMRLLITNEFRMLASMRHPNIISVLDYGFTEDDAPYFTMEYLPNAQTILDAAETAKPSDKIVLLIQTLQALEYLHRRKVLHRDLKPDNILVVDHKVKVLDFGISVFKPQVADADQAGTLRYMAPEALIDSASFVEQSDLWAMGIIAFQMFNFGEHPFATENSGAVVMKTIMETPDFDSLDVSYQLRNVIERLLEKSADDRYQQAQTVIDALLPLSDESIAPEPEEIREAYLQTAPFVGREDVLDQLVDELSDAQNGNGKIHLVSGVSGIGKSRLLDEVRVRALVMGTLVLRGQGQRDADQPYGLWYAAIRRLILMVALTDTQAAILKPIIPDIGQMIGREVGNALDLDDANAAQRRLFDVIDDLLRQIARPILILLEDLHWTDSGSVDLLSYLAKSLQQRSVMVLASYRSDEVPELAKSFQNATVTHLNRLADDNVRQLAKSMLGTAGDRVEVVDLLKRESEGNVFFLVETIRELAQQSGQLTQIGIGEFPEKIFPHGIQDIVKRRLSKIEKSHHATLQLAAVSGREVDVALLRSMEPETVQEDWLTICANYAILDVVDGEWRFSHNKIRDGILEEIPKDDLRQLHRRLAETKSTFYNEQGNHEVAIARHWEAAEETEQAGVWYLKAARIALNAFAAANAIEYYDKASDYLPSSDVVVSRLNIYEGLGEMLWWQAQTERAQEVYTQMFTLADEVGDDLSAARALLGQADAKRDEGNPTLAMEFARNAQSRAMVARDAANKMVVVALSYQAFLLYRQRDYTEAREVAEKALDLATEQGLLAEVARNQNVLGIVYLMLGDTETAEKRMKSALETAQLLGDRRSIAVRHTNLGELYRRTDRFDASQDHFQQALEIYDDIGARDGWLTVNTNLAGLHNKLGKYEQGEASIRAVLNQLKEPQQWYGILEAMQHLVEALYHQERYYDALESTQEWLDLALSREDRYSTGLAWSFAARTSWKLEISFSAPERDYKVSECFQVAQDALQQHDSDRAAVIVDWALFEFQSGDVARARELKNQAIPLLMQLELTAEIERLNTTIPADD